VPWLNFKGLGSPRVLKMLRPGNYDLLDKSTYAVIM
jgi:hypothetical protein